MCSDIVLQDIPDGTVLKCVTQHPDFNAVCLEKWSLHMAAKRLKTSLRQEEIETDWFGRKVTIFYLNFLLNTFLCSTSFALPL